MNIIEFKQGDCDAQIDDQEKDRKKTNEFSPIVTQQPNSTVNTIEANDSRPTTNRSDDNCCLQPLDVCFHWNLFEYNSCEGQCCEGECCEGDCCGQCCGCVCDCSPE